MTRLSLIPVLAFFSVALAALGAGSSPSRMFASSGTHMIVFAGDSIDVNSLTFIIDGDTVSREQVVAMSPRDIYSLTVTKSPANCMEIISRKSMEQPLPASEMPGSAVYMIDSLTVDAATFSSFPPDSISSLTVKKGDPMVLRIVTRSQSADL